MNHTLNLQFTEHEILQALKQIHPAKAPGPDGFPACFYQHYWSEIGPDTLKTTLNILNDNKPANNINHTLLTLIPKVKKPANMT